MSLFQKQPDGSLSLLRQDESTTVPSLHHMLDYMVEAVKTGACSQLVLVGSRNDISWAQAVLPETIAHRIIAEIEYPLLSSWFHPSSQMKELVQRLAHLFQT